MFLQGVGEYCFIFAQKNSYKTPFLKSYSFAIDNIELLLVLIIRIFFNL